ncbi:hypothetical protein NKJ36_32825 [Mesorhizobium sp. M0142]|uniref:COG3904 family protein n=1 Tax=Mesorhizobium sp. M0142 TaxID=2956894 RepID=UPI00333D6FC5
MAMAAFAAKAEDVFPKWSDPTTWTDPKLLSDDLSPMRFVVVRSNATGCESNCPEWISAEGAIEAGTPAQFKRILKTLGRRKLPIIVNSPGGNVDAALQLGRIIRKNKLDIAVGTTKFSDCWPGMKDCRANDGKGAAYFGIASDGGAMCNSACPLMFAGGVGRVVGGWAYLGVHQITTTYFRTTRHYRTTYRVVRGKKYRITTETITQDNAGYKTYEMSKALERKLSAYLRDMGVGRGVIDRMKATPASDIRQIALDDMLTMKLITSRDSLDILTQAGICQRRPAPPNCGEVPANAKPAKVAAIEAKAGPSQPAQVPLSHLAKEAPAQPVEAVPGNEAPDKGFILVRGSDPMCEPHCPEWIWARPLVAVPGNGAPEMRFVVVRRSNSSCNPDCPEWISAQGVITSQTPQKLGQLLATLGSRRLPIVVSSRGGELFSALAMGRLIREKKLDVAVARTDFVGCDPEEWNCLAKDGAYAGVASDAKGDCDSACALMLAGGVRRLVGPRALLSLYLMGQAQLIKAYLDEMAINRDLFMTLQRISVERQLEPDVMLRAGLTTGPQSVDELTGATLCRSVPKPDNCRVVLSPNAQAEAPAKL